MTLQLLETADLAGMIREKTGIKEPDPVDPCIGIKPNLVTPSPAMFGATTHPEIVEGIILYLKKHRFTNLMICEGSWVVDKTSEAFEYCGYRTLAEKYDVRLLDTQKDSSFAVSCQAPQNVLHLCSCLKDIDYLINVPVLKGHCQTKMTCALKNMKGMIPNSEKRRFHSLGLHKPIAYLNTVIHQDFIVVDHICGDPDFEEGGNPLVTNCIMAAMDPVLTDAYACQILGYLPDEIAYVRLAAVLGVGCDDLSQLQIRHIDSSAAANANSNDAILLTHKALQLNYATHEIESCSACYSALTEALRHLNEEGLLRRLTDELHVTFHIGQGYRGQSNPEDIQENAPAPAYDCTSNPEHGRALTEKPGCEAFRRVGIGNCTRLFAQNIPGCPPTGDEIYHFLKAFVS